MKNLNAFLNPKRKENLKFVLSDAFVDENGQPLEWEMRQLSGAEMLELAKLHAHEEPPEVLAATVAAALVTPDLRDAELLKALSQREGHGILDPRDALLVLVTDAEYARLYQSYIQYNDLGKGFGELADEAKN